MTTQIIQPQRITRLNDRAARDGQFVLYWMQQSQRAECNHALEFAVRRANQGKQPLLVLFVLMDDYPEANRRHYRFLLEGIQETQRALAERTIKMVVRIGSPEDIVPEVAAKASLVVCDRGYLRHQKAWREAIGNEVKCEVVQVESDVVVPVEVASDKREYAARTIRPRLQRHHDEFLVELRSTPLHRNALSLSAEGVDVSDVDALLDELGVDSSVPSVESLYCGGTAQARAVLRSFIQDKLKHYDENRNRPETSDISQMSMYLHFGQISPLYVALRIRDTSRGSEPDRQAYLEELLIRRELAQNFVHFTDDYDAYSCLPDWARQTLQQHRDDPRAYHYTRSELEQGQTHDEYWNAAMREMRETGFMHNYMRMYWGKKIVEWTNTPEYAYRVALELNNKYFLDGRDPNSFANVAWIFGNHDRAFSEREVFGKVRYLSARGLERKSDPAAYVQKVQSIVDAM